MFEKRLKYNAIKAKIVTAFKIYLLPDNKYSSENAYSRYFGLKNKSVARLCTDFLSQTIVKIKIS